MKTKEIKSRSNPSFRLFLSLSRSRGIRRHRKALFAGLTQVKEILNEFPDLAEGLISTREMDIQSLEPDVAGRDVPFYILPDSLFKECDIFGTGSPLLIVDVQEFPAWEGNEALDGCTVLLGFQDPSNVGTVIRSAAGLGADRVVLLKEAAHPFHPRSMRSGGSSLLRIPMLQGPSIYELGETRLPVVALTPGATNLGGFSFPPSFLLLPGIEGPGLPDSQIYDCKVGIPMERGVESINSAHAAAIAIYCWRRQLNPLPCNPPIYHRND